MPLFLVISLAIIYILVWRMPLKEESQQPQDEEQSKNLN
jgi:hypothetical protein